KHIKQTLNEKVKGLLEDEQDVVVNLEESILNLKRMNSFLRETSQQATKGERIIKEHLQEVNKLELKEQQRNMKESLDTILELLSSIIQMVQKEQSNAQDIIKSLEQCSIKEKISIQDK